MIVMKFGGTSVGDTDAIKRLIKIVELRLERNPVIVVSAISKATDTLHIIAELATSGKFDKSKKMLDKLKSRHLEICKGLLRMNSDGYIRTKEKINSYFGEINDFVKSVNLLSELSDRSLARIISYGELLSSYIIYEALNEQGMKCNLIDARNFIYTDSNYLKGEPDIEYIIDNTQKSINKAFEDADMVITQGFISNTRNKITTTLGRGGSDYTASLIGMALNADEIEIWTDVDGINTADPRKVKNTRSVSVMTFEEAAELAYFGAKVLHPSTIQPAVERDIPVRILNSKSFENHGTLVLKEDIKYEQGVRSISCKEKITVLNIYSTKMLNSFGFLYNLFKVFDKHRTSVDLIATSEVNVSLTIDSDEHLDDIVNEISVFSKVFINKEKSLVCVVGKDLKYTKGIAKRVFNSVGDYNITMISQGASVINISFVVDKKNLNNVLQNLHDEFFESNK